MAGRDGLRPRRESRVAEAQRLLAAREPLIATYRRGDLVRTVRVAATTPSRAAILRLRRAFYERKLAQLGVPVWDEHDESALHLLCTEERAGARGPRPPVRSAAGDAGRPAWPLRQDRMQDSKPRTLRSRGLLGSWPLAPRPRGESATEPVGVLRVALNRDGRGDLHDDFSGLDELLTDGEEFLVLARELVVPQRRGAGVATALLDAACRYWLSRSEPSRRVLFTSLVLDRGTGEVFGATRATPIVGLGPRATPAALYVTELGTMAGRVRDRLRATGWTVTPGAGAGPARAEPARAEPARAEPARATAPAGPGEPLALPLRQGTPPEPPGCYRRLRRERPVCRVRMPTGDLGWLVTRYEDARLVLADPRFSKAALREAGAPRARPGTLPPGLLFTTDPPEHTALRARVRAALGRPRTEAARGMIAGVARDLAAELAASTRADLVEEFARPFALRVMCGLLGVPGEDEDDLTYWAETVLTANAARPAEVEAAQRDLMAYGAGLVAARRDRPGDDMVSALLAAGTTGDAAADARAATTLVATLLATGYETMVAAVANSVLVLLAGEGGLPDPWPADPRHLVEELLRLSTFGDALRSRRATADVRIGDVLLPAGDVVLVSLASANRDETAIPRPDRVRPAHERATHLAFGHGPHRCPAAALARAELGLALEHLAARFPRMRLAVPPHEIVLRTGSAESPPEALPVLLRG